MTEITFWWNQHVFIHGTAEVFFFRKWPEWNKNETHRTLKYFSGINSYNATGQELEKLGSNIEPFDCCLCVSCRMRVGVTAKDTGKKQKARKRKAFFLPSFLFFFLLFFSNYIFMSSLRSSNMSWSYLTNSSHTHLHTLPIQHFVHFKNKARPIKTKLFCSNILGCVTFHWSTVDLSGATQKVGHEVPHLGKELFALDKLLREGESAFSKKFESQTSNRISTSAVWIYRN